MFNLKPIHLVNAFWFTTVSLTVSIVVLSFFRLFLCLKLFCIIWEKSSERLSTSISLESTTIKSSVSLFWFELRLEESDGSLIFSRMVPVRRLELTTYLKHY